MNLLQLAPDMPPGVVRLPANGTTVTAEALRHELAAAIDNGAAFVVDGSAVQTIGQAVLQILVAARRAAVAAERSLTIIDPSDALRACAEACCLAEAIGLAAGKAPAL